MESPNGFWQEDGYFSSFISDGLSTEIYFVIFAMIVFVIIYAGVRNGIEHVSKFMMPIAAIATGLLVFKVKKYKKQEFISCK